MDRSVYDNMAKLDEQHWWYVARRDILDRLIRAPHPAARGRAHPGDRLRHRPQSADARASSARWMRSRSTPRRATWRASGSASRSWRIPLPALEGVEDGAYDMVAILDVLEHVAEDKAALTGIASKLKPGGRILITVPAHPWMWSAHDVVNHHQRRYTRRTLKKVIADAGLRLDMLRWFNSLLFPRRGGRAAGRAAVRQGGRRRHLAAEAGQLSVREDFRAGAARDRPRCR